MQFIKWAKYLDENLIILRVKCYEKVHSGPVQLCEGYVSVFFKYKKPPKKINLQNETEHIQVVFTLPLFRSTQRGSLTESGIVWSMWIHLHHFGPAYAILGYDVGVMWRRAISDRSSFIPLLWTQKGLGGHISLNMLQDTWIIRPTMETWSTLHQWRRLCVSLCICRWLSCERNDLHIAPDKHVTALLKCHVRIDASAPEGAAFGERERGKQSVRIRTELTVK